MASSGDKDEHLFDKAEPDRVEHLSPHDLTLRWQPGEFVRFVLPSSIEYANWDRNVVARGGRCALEIGTLFVGPGSPVEVELTDGRGKKLAVLTETRRGTPLQVYKTGEGTVCGTRVEVPPRLTRKAEGHLLATVRLPGHGLRRHSQAKLRVGPRVVVQDVKFLKEHERAEVRRVQAGTPVRVQAVLEAYPKGALPAGTRGEVSLWRLDEQEADVPLKRFRGRVKGPPGRRGLEVVWIPTVEQVALVRGRAKSRAVFSSQRTLGERRAGTKYAGAKLYARVEVWGALGTTMERRGSGPLEVRDALDVQVVVAGSDEDAETPLAKAEVKVELPDGSTQKHKLDEQGRLRLDDVPPGECYLTFPSESRSKESSGHAGSAGPSSRSSSGPSSESQPQPPARQDVTWTLLPGRGLRAAHGDKTLRLSLLTGGPYRVRLDFPFGPPSA